MLRTYNQHHFQILAYGSKTQEAMNCVKDSSKEKQNKIESNW